MRPGIRRRADAALMLFLSLLWLPGRIVEEGIHALAALPYAEVVSVRLEPRSGEAKTVVQFRENAPEWAISAAYVAPEVLATISGLAVIAFWLAGGDVWGPSSTLDWVLLSILGAQYLAIALPSAADVDQTAEGQA